MYYVRCVAQMGRPTPVCVSWRTMPAESTGISRWSHRQVGKKQDFKQKSPFFPERMLKKQSQMMRF